MHYRTQKIRLIKKKTRKGRKRSSKRLLKRITMNIGLLRRGG